jgi:hypothetical protein
VSRTSENTAFTCLLCGLEVVSLSNGSYRNHCPDCLYSQHLDVAPGDRSSLCRGTMEPVGTRYRSDKGLQVVHRCMTCGVIRLNRVAKDTVQPDDLEALLRLPAV